MANMPKRRKSKDNPYTLDYNDNEHIYTVSFMDNKQVIHNVEVSKKVFEAFDKFELEDISQLHKMDKHIDGRNIDNSDKADIILYHLGVPSTQTVDKQVEEKMFNEEIRNAINQLSDVQKRRIIMYYFDGLTQQQIADIEGTSLRAVQYTLNSAIEKLKEILKKLKN